VWLQPAQRSKIKHLRWHTKSTFHVTSKSKYRWMPLNVITFTVIHNVFIEIKYSVSQYRTTHPIIYQYYINVRYVREPFLLKLLFMKFIMNDIMISSAKWNTIITNIQLQFSSVVKKIFRFFRQKYFQHFLTCKWWRQSIPMIKSTREQKRKGWYCTSS
jgi:hypothetical protein